MENTALERIIWIAAPRERVWRAITDPVQIQQWFSPPTPWEMTTPDVGGKVYAVGYESQAGIIEVIDAPRQFSYRWDMPDSHPPLTTMTTYSLEEENGGTRVTLTEVMSETTPVEIRQKRMNESGGGWVMALENLKAYLEGKDLPYPEGL
jgi:uncharacterized protein YndB with AHSA1/START domain